MALIKCSDCGKQMSEKASFCPHCGCTNQPYTYCSVCGEKTKEGNYCTNCGTTMTNNYEPVNKKPMCGVALAGGVTGICSLLIDLFGIVGIAAVVLSSIGLSKTSNGLLRGKGWAVTGLVCGIIEVIYKTIIIITYFS